MKRTPAYKRDPRVDLTANAAASFYQVPAAALFGPGRTRSVVRARLLAIVLLKRMTDMNDTDICAAFGRDRSLRAYAEEVIGYLDSRARDNGGEGLVQPFVDSLTDECDRLRRSVCFVQAAVIRLQADLMDLCKADIGLAMAVARALPDLTRQANEPTIELTPAGQEACASLMLGEPLHD